MLLNVSSCLNHLNNEVLSRKWKSLRQRFFIPLNPLVGWVAVAYFLVRFCFDVYHWKATRINQSLNYRILQFVNIVGNEFWPQLWRRFVHHNSKIVSSVKFTSTDIFHFSVPESDFTRERIKNYFVYESNIQAALLFWILSGIVLLMTNSKLFHKFTIQENEEIPWRKTPKVRKSFDKLVG